MRTVPLRSCLCGINPVKQGLINIEMEDKVYRGIVSFVQHEKHFATIEYKQGSKTKTVNCKTAEKQEGQKSHYFRVGDEITFRLKLTERGDKMRAFDIRFLYNANLDKLIQKAKHENRFSGYLKQVDDTLFVKEQETYLFFPLKLSPWENRPGEQSFNAPVTFRLTDIEKPRQVAAALYFQVFKPEYREAQEAFENKKPLPAVVRKVSPHSVYVDLFGGSIRSKINLPAEGMERMQPDDTVEVRITYMSADRVVVEKA